MEVDLLCTNARLVIELDGGQHLANTDAYRRDRRKDALLQKHGYFVLRFLAEDVGKKLDLVLDTILQTLSHLTQLESLQKLNLVSHGFGCPGVQKSCEAPNLLSD